MSTSHHVRVFLCELQVDPQGKFFAGDKEVSRVDVIGTVVYFSHRERVETFEIDDGTGIIQCAKFTDVEVGQQDGKSVASHADDPLKDLHHILIKPDFPLKLGDLVNIRGHLNVFRERPQLIVNSLRRVADINEEWFRVLEIDAEREAIRDKSPAETIFQELSQCSLP